MARFDTYRDAFSNARLTRKPNGVLEVMLHTGGGKLVFDGHTHEQFVDLFHAIGEDRDNRAVILTGAGDAFMDAISPEGFDFFTPQGYDKILREGRKVLGNILDIEVPMITALNGPVRPGVDRLPLRHRGRTARRGRHHPDRRPDGDALKVADRGYVLEQGRVVARNRHGAVGGPGAGSGLSRFDVMGTRR